MERSIAIGLGCAAVLAAFSKALGDYAPVPGKQRPLHRRNLTLALLARNGFIPAQLARRYPERTDPHRHPQAVQDRGARRDRPRARRRAVGGGWATNTP